MLFLYNQFVTPNAGSRNYGSVAAVIAAAGESQRMDGIDKLFAPLAGRAVLARVIDVFQKCPLISRIVVAVSRSNLETSRKLVADAGGSKVTGVSAADTIDSIQSMAAGAGWSKVTDVCIGGRRRQDSVLSGLQLLGPADWVIVHDGARPLVTEDLLERGLDAARETGAAAAAVPVTDTIKLAGADMMVRETLSRDRLWAVQTPQIFRFDVIAEAYRRVKDDVTDDAALVERAGGRVKLYMGAYDNIKITTPADLSLAELLWQRSQG